jgi:hypothetical protein
MSMYVQWLLEGDIEDGCLLKKLPYHNWPLVHLIISKMAVVRHVIGPYMVHLTSNGYEVMRCLLEKTTFRQCVWPICVLLVKWI